MNMLKGILIILIGGALFFFGFVIDNFPFIEWDRKVKVYEVFQVMSTLLIGIGIPFFIKKWIDDGRIIKNLLKEEASDISNEAIKVKDFMVKAFTDKKLAHEDKQYLLYLFNQLENLLLVYENSLKSAFGEKYNSPFQDLKIAYYEYWQRVTDGELMKDSFSQIDLEFLSYFTAQHNGFLNSIRNFSIRIQK